MMNKSIYSIGAQVTVTQEDLNDAYINAEDYIKRKVIEDMQKHIMENFDEIPIDLTSMEDIATRNVIFNARVNFVSSNILDKASTTILQMQEVRAIHNHYKNAINHIQEEFKKEVSNLKEEIFQLEEIIRGYEND